jgi:glycosyltransferase involved in cell wall biosynthesis
MRILLVAGEFPPMQGGLGDFTQCLAAELVRQGCEVAVYTRRCAAGGAGPYALLPLAREWGWADLFRLARLASCFDVVNLQYQAAAYRMRLPVHFLPYLCRGIRKPLVVTFHDLRVPYLFPKAGRLRQWAVRLLLTASAGVIVTNEEDKSAIDGVVPPENSSLVRIGSNIAPVQRSQARRSQLRAEWGAREGDLVISYFGFLNASKGALDLVRALALLKGAGVPAILVFIGGTVGASDPTNAAYAQNVQAEIAKLGLRGAVRFTGFQPAAEVSHSLYASDLCALPYRDGVSLRRGTFMAALAHGLPIVTTAPAVPIPSLKHGQNVFLVPPANPAALAEGIRTVWEDVPLRCTLAEGARKLAGEFTWPAIATATLRVYEAALARSGGRR